MSYLFSSADSHSGGNWIEDWLYPDTGLYIWSVITFLLVLAILKWKAWGPLMQTLDERERRIKNSLNKAEQIVQDHAKSAQDSAGGSTCRLPDGQMFQAGHENQNQLTCGGSC